MAGSLIILAGATGHLGKLIASNLAAQGASVRALVRPGSAQQNVSALRELNIEVAEVDFESRLNLKETCSGGSVVVSALSGLRPVIVDAQKRLLQAALDANAPRFIPSDYSIDFTRLPAG